MSKISKSLTVLLLIISILTFAGCQSSGNSTELIIESGIIDHEYSGKVVPMLPKEYKVSEKDWQQLEGFEKLEIYSKVKVPVKQKNTTPIEQTPEDNNSGGGHGAKPQV